MKNEMDVKPIFTIGIPGSFAHIHEVQEKLSQKLSDYHVLAYTTSEKEPQFQAFHQKPITDIEFEELKQTVLEVIK